MTDGDALLAAIRLHPDEDVPRLAYADWLDENAGDAECGRCKGLGWRPNDTHITLPEFATIGCPECGGTRDAKGTGWVSDGDAERAELIRVGCEWARMGEDSSRIDVIRHGGFDATIPRSPKICREWKSLATNIQALRSRERTLIEYGRMAGWFDLPLAPGQWKNPTDIGVCGPGGVGGRVVVSGTVRRGFLDSITLPAEYWLAHADAILAVNPLQEVTLTTLPLLFYETLGGEWVDTTDRDWGDADHATVWRMIETKCRYRWPRIKRWNLPSVNSLATLSIDQWVRMDEQILRAARESLRGMRDVSLSMTTRFAPRDTGMLRRSIVMDAGPVVPQGPIVVTRVE